MNPVPEIFIDAFDYELPPERIADRPISERDRSKLLIYKNGEISDDYFYHLPHYLDRSTTLILNNTKVIAARLFFQKESGGIIEIFCLEPVGLAVELAMEAKKSVQWRCLIGGASKWKHGLILQKTLNIDGLSVEFTAAMKVREEDSFIIEFTWNAELSFSIVLEQAGAIPLPPYIKRKLVQEDTDRYQTVFARNNGSVAAPTASLHFTNELFDQLAKKDIRANYVTLHVGAGTFKPVKAETIAGHQMHSEPFSVSMETLEQLAAASVIVAAGTTSLRTLESLYWLACKLRSGQTEMELGQWEAYQLNDYQLAYREGMQILIEHLKTSGRTELQCRTSLLITPGYRFRSAHALITNFHQPRSTLLLLIAAFIGEDWRKVYHHALHNQYRFLSYGDSSLLWRKVNA